MIKRIICFELRYGIKNHMYNVWNHNSLYTILNSITPHLISFVMINFVITSKPPNAYIWYYI